ncbi:MAG: DUF2726 domain-containing protein [Janthinobacterium lividum]
MLIALFVLVVLASVIGPSRNGEANVVARDLMTPREVEFWRVLRHAAGPLHVAPQVAMNALLNAAPGMDRRRSLTTRNRFDRKVVDFALVDDWGGVRLLVELDDRTHVADRDAKRDRMTARAGYTTLRVSGREARDAGLLTVAIAEKLGLPA